MFHVLNFWNVATVSLDDSFAQYWLYLNQFHEVVTWNVIHLTDVPCDMIISKFFKAFEISCVVSR